MQLIFILLAISLPVAGIAFLFHRAKLAKDYKPIQAQTNLSRQQAGRSKINGFLVGIVFLLIAIIGLMFFKDSIGFGTHKYTATKFSPQELMDLVEHNENDIAGKCKNKFANDFADNSSVYVQNHKYGCAHSGDRIPYEEVITFEDRLNLLIYSIRNEKKYKLLWSEFKKMNPVALSLQESDVDYPDDSTFSLNNCILIKHFIADNNSIVVIRRDKFMPLVEENEDYQINRGSTAILNEINKNSITSTNFLTDEKTLNLEAGELIIISAYDGKTAVITAKHDIDIVLPVGSKIYLDYNSVAVCIHINGSGSRLLLANKNISAKNIEAIIGLVPNQDEFRERMIKIDKQLGHSSFLYKHDIKN